MSEHAITHSQYIVLYDIHSHKTYPLFIVTWIYKHSLEEQEYTHCIQYTFVSVNYKCGIINKSSGYFAYGFLHFLITISTRSK